MNTYVVGRGTAGRILYKNAFGREWIMLMCTKKIDKSWERCYSVHVRSTKECLTGFCLVWGCQIN
ncbi:hypothetical protein D4758_27860 [Enterocloster citroniae]|nr:hypothetical protein [Enterocloster citroniae]RGC08549.1 hypothetical protein DWZ14_20050 [Enterocloster citroniae]